MTSTHPRFSFKRIRRAIERQKLRALMSNYRTRLSQQLPLHSCSRFGTMPLLVGFRPNTGHAPHPKEDWVDMYDPNNTEREADRRL